MPSGFSCRWKGAAASILKDEKDFVIGVLWKIPISELAELDIQGKRVEKIIKELRTVAYGTKSLKFNTTFASNKRAFLQTYTKE